MTQPTMMELGYMSMGGSELYFHPGHSADTRGRPGERNSVYSKGDGFDYVNVLGSALGEGFFYYWQHLVGLDAKVKGNGNFLYKEIALEEIAFFHDRVKWKISRPVEIDSCVELIDKFLAQE